MEQAVDIHGHPKCENHRANWLGRLRSTFFGSRRTTIATLRHCSPHFLRDIGLADDARMNRLLRDDVLFRR
ncbi:MAG: hypothetical protein R3D05_19165 [Dongiaceae bacterium]